MKITSDANLLKTMAKTSIEFSAAEVIVASVNIKNLSESLKAEANNEKIYFTNLEIEKNEKILDLMVGAIAPFFPNKRYKTLAKSFCNIDKSRDYSTEINRLTAEYIDELSKGIE